MMTDLETNGPRGCRPTDSPGRIDASCVLVYSLIAEVNQGAIVHGPLPTAPQPGQFGRGE